MKKLLYLCFLTIIASIAACKTEKNIEMKLAYHNSKIEQNIKSLKAPIADKIPFIMEKHGDKRTDNYYWMRLSDSQKTAETPDEATQKVLNYLNEENAYREQAMSDLKDYENTLFEEIKGRIKQTDMSVPFKKNGYYYITRYEEGKEYPIYTRKHNNLESAEEIMLDVNQMAIGHEYYQISGVSASPDNMIIGYGVDTVSRRQYVVQFKNLKTGEILSDRIQNTTGSCVWAADSKTVFYSRKDESLRSFKIFKHVLGTDASLDEEVYHEKDETFSTVIYKTKSDKFIIIASFSTLSQEYRILEADKPDGEFRIFQPRIDKLEYSIYHYEDQWYIRTNKDKAENFKLMRCPVDKTNIENWEEFIPHRSDVLLEDIEIFKNYLVVAERIQGLTKLRVKPWAGGDFFVEFDEEAYLTYPTSNYDFDTEVLRLGFTSMTTPNSIFDYNMGSREFTLLKEQEVLGGYDKNDYQSERIMVKARDGALIPVSIVYKKGFEKDGTRPVLLYGYCSYGNSMDPYFSSPRLSLLNRGFAFAIAHIRGGMEMGRQWYENGKYFKKINTFTDFIDCGKYLTSNKYAAEDKLFAMGGSAGGLLMGAVANMEPKMWGGIVAAVPFVDVVTTMLDESIPLTTGEYDEWGNPNQEDYYTYMKSYSPYDNVEQKNYPPMLVTTGYFDSQVQYWEPAKWVAKMRELKTDQNPLLMYCNMDAGHGGASGRFKQYKETAMEYAFLLDIAGLSE
ncbi:MAG TPA: S9 family peptidase [Saprospiraceae bacterium]|nr:S9 family peptidase [Saprospiraceae bacterium]